ncbi:hypothetical protein SEA_JONJAMES_194 [Gordonia Phage JonJames]|nr:hypothetical protein SEA_JONJAMES_194 [Gordonia Phage JonJames]
MMPYTDKRKAFLSDILITAELNYWATVDLPVVEDAPDDYILDYITVGYRVTPYDDNRERLVTLATIERGLAMMRHPSCSYINNGYRPDYHGSTQQRFAQLSDTDGDEGDYDTLDADAIIQLGLFGKVVYG